MVQTEGSLAIEAAKQRLAAAKAQKSAASTMVQSVVKALENAKKNEDLADNEVVKADAFLKEMEKRWEVIEIDDNDDPSGSNKRQKVTDDDTAVVQTRTERANITSTSSSSSTRNDQCHFKEVVVSGCTTRLNANGTYTLCDASHPLKMRKIDNTPVYHKPGGIGYITCHPLNRGDESPKLFYWIIKFKTDQRLYQRSYTSDITSVNFAPPKDGWRNEFSSVEPNMKISYQ